jgi:DNA ligase (NAD+)
MGDKSIQNMLQGIELSKQVPFEKVLFAIGIRLVGETVAKTLVKHFPNIHLLAAASFEELVAIHEIGDKIALNVQAWFSNPENLELINRLENSGLQLTSTAVVSENASDKLAGKTFLISGVFQKFDRDEIKQLVETNGGKNLSSISSKLNFLIAGENMGPAKLAKATELGIRIISEDEFEGMIQ